MNKKGKVKKFCYIIKGAMKYEQNRNYSIGSESREAASSERKMALLYSALRAPRPLGFKARETISELGLPEFASRRCPCERGLGGPFQR